MAELSSKNECAKSRPKEDPYEVWEAPNGWQWLVLKKYKSPKSEAADPYARWYCYVQGGDSYPEYGDTYVSDITRYARRIR
jgi:hypothetical protein